MKYALINDLKTQATKGSKGVCPCCGSEVIAKCGEQKSNHWAHKGNRTCDPWWEPETEWHRSWKNKFPENWQEYTHIDDKTGEKHIADIRSDQGLIIEFQHSHIHPDERRSRENFYKNMLWVVDGTRLKRDYTRFKKERSSFIPMQKGIFQVDLMGDYLPNNWLQSSVPVIFDFLGNELDENSDDLRNPLYCLFPISFGRYGVMAEIPRSAFVKNVLEGHWIERAKNFSNLLLEAKQKEEQRKIEIQKQNQKSIQLHRSKSYWPRRIF